jgi:hypothetical protein
MKTASLGDGDHDCTVDVVCDDFHGPAGVPSAGFAVPVDELVPTSVSIVGDSEPALHAPGAEIRAERRLHVHIPVVTGLQGTTGIGDDVLVHPLAPAGFGDSVMDEHDSALHAPRAVMRAECQLRDPVSLHNVQRDGGGICRVMDTVLRGETVDLVNRAHVHTATALRKVFNRVGIG